MSGVALHLFHTQPDPQRLAAWAAKHGLLDSQGDMGYALHALLRAAFGEHAPQPFRYLSAEQGLLAYTALSSEQIAQSTVLADAEVAAALGLGATSRHGGFSVRPFPVRWTTGHVLGFEVRVRPVIRDSKSGSERDAFLVAVEKSAGAAVDRADVYVQWLRDQLEPSGSSNCEAWKGGAELIDARLERFRLLDVMRQTQREGEDGKRRRHVVAGPDAVISGRLRVADPEAFCALLVRGVGRHRSFGFGQLLLRSSIR